MDTPPTPTPSAPLIVLFDGTCSLCNSGVRFILDRDPSGRFRFAPLQSQIARELLTQHQLNPDDISSMVLINGEHAYLRSNALLRIAIELPDPWPLTAIAVYIPQPLRDAAYDFLARHRKQWFKNSAACPTPTAQEREQFLA